MNLSRSAAFVAVASIVVTLAFVSCLDDRAPRSPTAPSFATSDGPATLVGAGNIAKCSSTKDESAGILLDDVPGTVFTLGDAAYDNGTLTQYNTCYGPSWGRHKARTQPAPGDRDYKTAGAAGYFSYFGAAAGDPTKGYYSYDLGAWHVVVLNSGSTAISMAAGSPQEQWLRADLAAHPARCTIAYWHHPLFNSKDNPNLKIRPLWDALYAAGVDVIVNAHYAFYERFAPQTPAGVADPAGIREFIVGTGGAESQNPDHVRANSEVRNGTTPGVLKLTLDDGGYAWEFVPIAGMTFRDSGSGSCHGAPVAVNAGPDVTTNPGDELTLSVTFNDPEPNAAPWAYTVLWGDGTSSTGTTQSAATPITVMHSYASLGQYSARVSVTNSEGAYGEDIVAVSVVAPYVLVGAGDIGDCTTNKDSLTANLLDAIPGTVFAAGDIAYPDGTLTDFKNCYAPTWGRHKARTKPVPGNHEYLTPGAKGYFDYFGSAAGPSGKGYYSYNLGDWHIVALNSNISMAVGSPQETWLRADLANSTKQCTLAYWHHPLFSSGTGTTTSEARALWDALYAAGAEVVIVGHHHHYERFAPQTPTGVADAVTGIRQFIVGTGGAEGLFGLGPPAANSEVSNNSTFGVLKLTLKANSYAWNFIPIAGRTFTDAGSGVCHGTPLSGPNDAPTAVAGGPYGGEEGAPVTLDGSGSSDPNGETLTYAWTFGDGSTGTGVGPAHAYAADGTYTVTLVVTDTRGAVSSSATTTATITNAPPVVNTGPDQTAQEDSPFSLNVGFTDPDPNDAPWMYTIEWGDGSPNTTGASQVPPISATHTYTAAGTNTVRVTIVDKDGGSGTGQLTVTVLHEPPVTVVGAGNIARCDRTGDEATAALLDLIQGTVFALGDAAFPGGTATAYQDCFDPNWGRHKARTTPVLGHREYDSSATAAGYFGYWGAQAGDPPGGYYSYDLGAWHIIVLNSNNAFVSTAVGSPQESWLRADLAATTQQCVLALFHHPRFYSTTGSTFVPTASVKPFWDALYAAGAELIVNAHMRDYERFAPQTPVGVADPVNGIREIIVGTGGEGLDQPNTLITPNSEVQISGVFGVLKLTLGDGSYTWEFVPVAGQTATDSGTGTCH